MPTVDVVNLSNQKVGELDLADAVFAAEINKALLYEAVRHSQSAARAGTVKTKVRGDVAGSGKPSACCLCRSSAMMAFWRSGSMSPGSFAAAHKRATRFRTVCEALWRLRYSRNIPILFWIPGVAR